MRPTLHICATATALALLGGACSSSSTGSSQETGGTASTGGTVSSGGKVGSSGTTGFGGMVGSGGKVGTGGSTTPTPTGGRAGSGGAAGTTSCAAGCEGGTTGSGGAGRDAGGRDMGSGMGGRTGTGGSTASSVDGGTPPSGDASAGCGSSITTSTCGAKGTTCSLTVNSKSRTYYVQLPSGYSSSKQYPLIFQFHPWGGSADQALTMYQLNSKIPDAIYVTPQGLDAGGNGPGWANSSGEDIAFTKAMLADVQGKFCVDNARIFSTGFSYGGMMSFAIGCEMSDVFRAIAPMSGSLYSDANCKGTGPHVAMWGSHGTSDTVVPIADGRKARDKILQENHCGTTTTAVDPSPCVKYQGCDPGYDVTWCEWDGPHGIPSFGNASIATFFKSFM